MYNKYECTPQERKLDSVRIIEMLSQIFNTVPTHTFEIHTPGLARISLALYKLYTEPKVYFLVSSLFFCTHTHVTTVCTYNNM